MCHLLVRAPAGTPPIEALRAAQVVAMGGPRCFAEMLMKTRLGRLHGPDQKLGEPFWHEVIAWLCRHADVASTVDELERVLGWIESEQRQAVPRGSRFSLSGRTSASVRRAADSHSVALERTGLDAPASPEAERGQASADALVVAQLREELRRPPRPRQ